MRVLNVGGRNKSHKIPSIYDGWDQVILDYTPGKDVDICMDARLLWDNVGGAADLANSFDAIYCSHTLEHFEVWDLPDVIQGFDRVLKLDGWLELIVPDLGAIANLLASTQDPGTQIYEGWVGPVTIADLIYGYGPDIRENELFRHKNGFTIKSLRRALRPYFKWLATTQRPETCELMMLAYRAQPRALPYSEWALVDSTGAPTRLPEPGES